jgi:hypothetical protein
MESLESTAGSGLSRQAAEPSAVSQGGRMIATWVKFIGIAMMTGAVVSWMMSYKYVKPGVSRWDIRLRSPFVEPSNLYQPFGWRLILVSRFLAVLGFVLLGASIFIVGGG